MQLVRAYCRGRLRSDAIETDLLPLRRRWTDCLSHRTLAWYTRDKIRLGAHATIVGLSLEQGRWQAMAVGDSCLYQVRDDRLVTAFPIADAAEFGNRPALLGSVAASSGHVPEPVTAAGMWRPGDVFYLMTDALALWCLAGSPDEDRLSRLAGIDGPEAFASFVHAERARCDAAGTAALANDDTTLLRVQPLDGAGAGVATTQVVTSR